MFVVRSLAYLLCSSSFVGIGNIKNKYCLLCKFLKIHLLLYMQFYHFLLLNNTLLEIRIL